MNVPEMVCEGFEEKPVIYGGQFKFKEITEVDRERLRKAREEARSGPKPLQMIAKFKVNDKRKAIGGIHLKITGKRQQLETYLASEVDLGLLKSAAR